MMTRHNPARTIAYWAARAEKAEEERDEARSLECSDLDAHWRLDEAMETIQRLAQERNEARATKNMHKERARQALADLDRAEARIEAVRDVHAEVEGLHCHTVCSHRSCLDDSGDQHRYPCPTIRALDG